MMRSSGDGKIPLNASYAGLRTRSRNGCRSRPIFLTMATSLICWVSLMCVSVGGEGLSSGNLDEVITASVDALTGEVRLEGATDGKHVEVDLGRVSSRAKTRSPVTTVDQPERMVVIGDVHGDIDAFGRTLRMAGLVDDKGQWAGGETVLVQAGDIFDRGDSDLEIEEWLWVLKEQARESGGAVLHLLGNHEVMNALGDHSSASHASFKPFEDLSDDMQELMQQHREALASFPDWVKPRLVAMSPSGPVANMLASHSVVMKVGDSLFVHGGLRPQNIEPKNCNGASGMACLESLNRRTHEWLLGEADMPREELWGRDSPIWSRFYSQPAGEELGTEEQKDLAEVLEATGTVRMIVGHTPQEVGINSAAGGKLWRTDTGMTAMIGGEPEVLEIVGGVATVITASGRIPGEERACKEGQKLPLLDSAWTAAVAAAGA